jgi:hypothetical protein
LALPYRLVCSSLSLLCSQNPDIYSFLSQFSPSSHLQNLFLQDPLNITDPPTCRCLRLSLHHEILQSKNGMHFFYMLCPSEHSQFSYPNNIRQRIQIMKVLIM